MAGPEAANNAAITATLIPLLTLGIPTSNTTAILLGAFQNYGIQPGPQLFDTNGALVWALIASLYIGNVMLLVLNLPLVGLWVKLLKIPKPPLYAGILIFATVGVYGMRQSAFDLVLLYAIGLLGVVMRRFDFPTAPVVVGMILGPLAEAQMRNALSIGEGKWSVFLERPMSLVLLVVVAAVLVLPRLLRLRRKRAARSETGRPRRLVAAPAASARWRCASSAAASGRRRRPALQVADRDVGQRGDPRRGCRSGRGCSGTRLPPASRKASRASWSISSSVSRQSAVKPGHITSTLPDALLRQLDQRRLGVGLQPLGLAEAALEGDDQLVRLQRRGARRAGARSSGTRSGTGRPAAACARARRGSSAPAARRGRASASARARAGPARRCSRRRRGSG